ncbi:uncharacterized protein LOC110186998 [Drosophila serrata]|uniref:uncharacterized protein LOC110186998 n=1 Tax=Drosophila serrata TaxID=7274 RepID=UPI000A1D1286|nr:uncharacterized protein LOC110186998 [Drosophila serrata]
MFAVSAVGATSTTARKSGKSPSKTSNNVMQASPAVVFMCVQHSQQQVPMLNNFMCMRMRGWHNNKYYCNNHVTTLKIGTGTGTATKVLKRSKFLRKKRDCICIRRCATIIRF